jgi:hypothetical protein
MKASEFKPGEWIAIDNVMTLTGGCYGVGVGTFKVVEKPDGGAFNGLCEDDEDTIFVNGNGIWHIGGEVRRATPEEEASFVYTVNINGCKAEYFPTHVVFGCARISKIQILLMHDLIKCDSAYSNKKVESVTIGRGLFTRTDIEILAEYYLKTK